MPPTTLSRRHFLQSGLTIAGGAALGFSFAGCAADQTLASGLDTKNAKIGFVDLDLTEPQVIASAGGILSAAIIAMTAPTTIAGRRLREPVTYNGTFPGPTLWVHPGDYVDINYTNKIVFDQADSRPGYGRPPRRANLSNLHYH